ncbi:MAG TPA: MarR family transcriptional regulator [Actinospica sp.]|jgi:predicted transcriptional regulator|nr:MarR family transcriptional regulator [Actinospica sp.]
MPKKKTTAQPAPAETNAPTAEAPVLAPAAQIVLALMDAENASTAAGLAERAGLARSTVTKALAALLDQGLAVRQDGGHEGARRIADRWFATPGATPPPAATHDDQPVARPGTDDEAILNAASAEDGDADEAEPNAENAEPEASCTAEPSEAGDPGTAEAPAADPDAVDGHSPDEAVAGADADQARLAPGSGDGAARLGKGELRSMVEAHLRENPDREWTPTAISKILGRSAGAITNACMKLAETGSVTIVPDKPVRFRWTAAA